MKQVAAIFLGTQGAGKGTQFKLLKQFLNEHDPANDVFTFDTGQSLRELHSKEGYAYHKMQTIMNHGKFLADWIPTWLFSDAMINTYAEGNHILIDGYPRSVGQAQSLNEVLNFYEIDQVDIINMKVSPQVAIDRALSRGRADDTEESVRSRLAETERVLQPVLDFIEKSTNYKIHSIDGEQHIEKVTADISEALNLHSN